MGADCLGVHLAFSDLRRPCPAMEISAPESGRVNVVVLPFNEDI